MKDIENNASQLLKEYLLKAELITEEQLQSVKQEQQVSGKNVEKILVEQGWIKLKAIVYLKDNLIYPLFASCKISKQNIKSSNYLRTEISAKNVFAIMFKIIGFFVCANLTSQLARRYLPDFFLRDSFATAFNLDAELNLPAVYSALTLLLCSLIIGIISIIKGNQQDSYTTYWKGLAIIFALLFFDELTSLHERLMEPVRNTLNTGGFLYFAWVIPGSIFVLCFLLIFLKFIVNLPSKTRNYFLLAGTIYVSGAIGCELIGGYIVDNYTTKSLLYLLEVTIEEALEMLGVAVFIYGLLSYISASMQGAGLKLKIPASFPRHNLNFEQVRE